jgi:hypothetical protein
MDVGFAFYRSSMARELPESSMVTGFALGVVLLMNVNRRAPGL